MSPLRALLLLAALVLSTRALALPDDPRQALAELDARAKPLEQVRYGATRVTYQNDTKQQERWFYASEAGGRFRVDYVGDTTRQIICDGHVLWDYVPAMGAAQRVELDQLPPADREAMLLRILAKVALPGVRTGLEAAGMSTVSWGEDGAVAGRPTRTVIATDDKGGRLSFVIDASAGYLISSRIEQNGEFLLLTEAFDHRELAPGLWLPARVVSTSPAPGGKVRAELQLNGMAVGQDLPDTLFEMKLDPAVQIRRVP